MTDIKVKCEVCQRITKDRFESEADFVAHERLLQKLIESGDLKKRTPMAHSRRSKYFFEAYYSCARGGEPFVLSHPDQAYRGFCLPIGKIS
jgi:hypothetical protein